MKKTFALSLALIAGLATLPLTSSATTFFDSTGENFTGAGGGILDISSVEINNTPTDLIFKINLMGDPVATDWGKYMVGINSVPGGDSAANGWSRPISMTGMDYWIGTWVDSGNGAELRTFLGGGPWALHSATYAANPAGLLVTKNSSSVTFSLSLASMGLSPGNSFIFDVFTSGGNTPDSAVDALANPLQSISDWPGPYASGSSLLYTVTPVPEPSMLALFGLAGGLMVRGFIRRR